MQQRFVVKTRQMQILEAERGRPIEELIQELYVEKGLTMEAAAAELGLDTSTLSRWMVTLGIPARPSWHRGEEPQEAVS